MIKRLNKLVNTVFLVIEIISNCSLNSYWHHFLQTYDSWKDKWLRFQEALPEFSWLKELRDSLPDFSNTFAGGIAFI